MLFIYDNAYSWHKILQHIANLLNVEDVKHNVALYVGMLSTPHSGLITVRHVVCYVDIPKISPVTRQIYNMIKHKCTIIANSRLTADLLERHLNIKVDDVVPHGIDVNVFNEQWINVPKLFDTYCMASGYREGLDRYVQFVHKYSINALLFTRSDIIIPSNLTVIRIDRYVPDCVIASIYAMSRTYLVTSRHEGFCIPVIESACVGSIPVVPCTLPYIEHDVPFKVMYCAWLDVDRLVNNPDGVYPVVDIDFEDMYKKLQEALKRRPSIDDIRYVKERYDYRKLYTKIVKYLKRR